MPIVESLHDVGAADAEPVGPVGPVVVHAERPVAAAVAVAALDDALEFAALEPFAQPPVVADVLNEQGV